MQIGDAVIVEGLLLGDYIAEYMQNAKDDQIRKFSTALRVDEDSLREFMKRNITKDNIDEFGRYTKLKETIDKTIAKFYFERVEGNKLLPHRVSVRVDKMLRRFVL